MYVFRRKNKVRNNPEEIYKNLPNKSYNIIYADFPWPYTSHGTARLPYKSLTENEIKSFPFEKLMAKQCIIFLWITSPIMDLQFRCIQHWIDKYSLKWYGIPFIWVKTRKDGSPLGASGPRPKIVKPIGEFVATIGNVKKGRPLPLKIENMTQWVYSEKEKIHSRKPKIVREKIDSLFLGNPTKIELFARESSFGWDVWGDQINQDKIT